MNTITHELLSNNKLILENGDEFIIPSREHDNYVNATALCRTVDRRIPDWLKINKTKTLLNDLRQSLPADIQLVEITRGGDFSKISQGTYIHPTLLLPLSKWCSLNYFNQITKWISDLNFPTENTPKDYDVLQRELINVKTKLKESNEQIVFFKKKAESAEKKLTDATNLVKSYDATNKQLDLQYRKLLQNYQSQVRRKEQYKLKEGKCVYLIDMRASNDAGLVPYYKIGQTGDISRRCSEFRTNAPNLKVLFVLYTDKNVHLEQSILSTFEKNRLPVKSEFISGVPMDILINTIVNLAKAHNFDFTIENDEELESFNGIQESVEQKEVHEAKEEPKGLKRCGGLSHATEEDRLQPYSNFFKNKHHKDGYARLCKECYLTGVYGDKRKKRKVVVIPEHDTTTHKWCNRCETVRSRSEFFKEQGKKDGLYSNCVFCKSDQKRIAREKAKANEKKDNDTKAEEKEMSVEVEETDEFEIVMQDETMDIDLMTLNVE